MITARGIENFGTMIVNNGKIISCDANGGAAIWNEGNLTVNGGTFTTGTGSTTTSGPGALNNQPGAKATLNGGNFIGDSPRVYAIITEGDMTIEENVVVSGKHGAVAVSAGLTTIKGGQFTCTSVAAQSDHVIYVGGGKVEIEDGSFTHEGTDQSGSTVVYTDTEGSAKIAGGEFVSENANTSGVSSHGDLVITNGSFNANAKVQIQSGSSASISGGTVDGSVTVASGATATISGGTIKGELTAATEDLTVTGGKFENESVQNNILNYAPTGSTIVGGQVLSPVKIPQKSRVSFVADGRLVGIVLYRKSQSELTFLPKVPAKEGYVGAWAEYELNGENMIVRAVYTPIAE